MQLPNLARGQQKYIYASTSTFLNCVQWRLVCKYEISLCLSTAYSQSLCFWCPRLCHRTQSRLRSRQSVFFCFQDFGKRLRVVYFWTRSTACRNRVGSDFNSYIRL